MGIGIFVAFVGLQNAGVVVASPTLVSIVDFRVNFHTAGICALLAVIGTMLAAVLYLRKFKSAMLLSILITWALGMLAQALGLYVPDAAAGYHSLYPTLAFTDFSRLGQTFGQCFRVDLHELGFFNFLMVTISFLFVDVFDTMGSLIGLANKAEMLDEQGRLPAIRPALMADAVATTVGAVLGTSTVTTFVETAAGIGAGGRTGLTALVTGALFLASMFLAPIFTAIPFFATAPVLILVGFLMVSTITKIQFSEENYTDSIPAYLCILGIPLFYSISDGIAIGVVSYTVINLCCGKREKLNPLMYGLSLLFILKFLFL